MVGVILVVATGVSDMLESKVVMTSWLLPLTVIPVLVWYAKFGDVPAVDAGIIPLD